MGSFTSGLEGEDFSTTNFAYHWNSLYLALRGNKVISGCKVSESAVAGLKIDVSSGYVWSNGAKITVSTETDFSLATQHATLAVGEAMYVMIVYDQSASDIAALDGTKGAAGSIFPPAFDDSSHVLLGLVLLTEADSQVNDADIDDLRIFVEQGAYFDGAIEVNGAITASGTSSLADLELTGSLAVDTIAEKTGSAGITLSDILKVDELQERETDQGITISHDLKIDQIVEKTSDAGVTVEQVLIKDKSVRTGSIDLQPLSKTGTDFTQDGYCSYLITPSDYISFSGSCWSAGKIGVFIVATHYSSSPTVDIKVELGLKKWIVPENLPSWEFTRTYSWTLTQDKAAWVQFTVDDLSADFDVSESDLLYLKITNDDSTDNIEILFVAVEYQSYT